MPWAAHKEKNTQTQDFISSHILVGHIWHHTQWLVRASWHHSLQFQQPALAGREELRSCCKWCPWGRKCSLPSSLTPLAEKRPFSLGSDSTKVTQLLTLPHPLGCYVGVWGRRPTFEHKLSSSHDPGGVHAPAVTALGIDGEGGVLADRVRVVVVMPFPGVIVVMEDEVACEEEDFGPHLTALAHPFAMQANGEVSLRGQEGRVMLIWPVDDSTGYAGMVVVLQSQDKHKERSCFMREQCACAVQTGITMARTGGEAPDHCHLWPGYPSSTCSLAPLHRWGVCACVCSQVHVFGQH